MVASMATPGPYMVTLTVGGREVTRSVTVLEDVWMMDR
jgi:PKD repeat protein